MSFDLINECARLIQINSISSNGSSEIVNHLISLVKSNDFDLTSELRTSRYLEADQINLIFHKGPKNGGAMVWNCHLDTVDPGNLSHWTEAPPFSGTIKGDKIYGLGSSDTKLGIICMLKALSYYQEKTFKIPFYLVGSACEEVGLYGIKELFKSPPFKPKYVINTEPSELKIVYAHKGLFATQITLESRDLIEQKGHIYKIEFHGVSAHSSTPHLGKNAVVMALEFLLKNPNFSVIKIDGGTVMNKVPESCTLEIIAVDSSFLESDKNIIASKAEQSQYTITKTGLSRAKVHSKEQISSLLLIYKEFLKTEEMLKKSKDERFDPPQTTTDIPILKDFGKKIVLGWGFRRLPSASNEETEQRVSSACSLASETFPDVKIAQEIARSSPPFENDINSKLIKECRAILRKLNLSDGLQTKAGSSEASIYREAGADTIVIGPGTSRGVIHKPNEYNSISQLNNAVEFYKQIIERFLV